MGNLSSVFRKVAAAQTSQAGSRFRDGTYDLTISEVICEKKDAGMCFIIEFKVDKSASSAEAYFKGDKACWSSDEGAKLMPANDVGSTVSIVWVLDNAQNKSALGNVKSWACALLDVAEDGVDEEDFANALEALVQKDQPARGRRIRMDTYRKRIKGGPNAGKPFIGTNWTHIPQADEEIASRCAELDSARAVEAAK